MSSVRQQLERVIARGSGSLDVFLRAHGTILADYARQLESRRPPTKVVAEQIKAGLYGSPECKAWLESEYKEAISASSRKFEELGYNGKTLADLGRRARRADRGNTWIKGLFSNFVAYGLPGFLALAITIPLSFVIGPVPLILIGLGISLTAAYKWSVHAVAAGASIGKQVDASSGPNGKRQRFTRVCPAKSLRSALWKEVAADLCARTGPRSLLTAPLRILSAVLVCLGVATSCASVISTLVGPLSVFIDAPTSASMQALSQAIQGRYNGQSLAPLYGVMLDPKKGIVSDGSAPHQNPRRLKKSFVARSFNTTKRVLRFYLRNFRKEYRAELKKGMDWKKWLRFFCGANALGVGESALGGIVGAAIGGPAETVLGTASDVVETGMNASFVLSRETVTTQIELKRKAASSASRAESSAQHSGAGGNPNAGRRPVTARSNGLAR